MFRRIRANFLTGLLIVTPAVLTFWVLYFMVTKLNSLLLEPVMNILTQWLPHYNIEFFVKLGILGLFFILVMAAGFATRIIIVRNIFGFGEKIVYRVPLISLIYGGFKELSGAILGQNASIFKKVVLVEYPRKGIYSVGFVTSETKGEVQEKTNKKTINVFLPTTPNPTSGMFVLVPEEDVISLDMSVADGMKMIISGGAVVPKKGYGNPENRGDSFKEKGP